MSLFRQKLIVLFLLHLYHSLALKLHMDKLPFALFYLISLLTLSIILMFLILNSSLKQLFFLSDHNTLHAHGSLLHLEFTISDFFGMEFFHGSVSFFYSQNLLESLLLPHHFIFELFLMPISSFK